jgi:two-component system response regulator ChvI
MGLILGGLKLGNGAPAGSGQSGDGSSVMSVGSLELNLESNRAFWRAGQVELTLTEFEIVRFLASRAGQDIRYREIYDLVHGKGFVAGEGPEGYRANVRTFIKRIRQKFRSIDSTFEQIENYPGFGYRWREG